MALSNIVGAAALVLVATGTAYFALCFIDTVYISMVCESRACTVVSQKWNLPRPPQSEVAIRPIVGGPSLVSMNGSQWKTWRSLLNSGFSDSNIMHHVPFIVDCVGVFCERLKDCVGKDMIFLDDLASRLTFDVIMKVTL
jgi:cytochrome P450